MNYKKIYFAFIEKYGNRVIDDGVYTEVHHILPRHAGGDDSKENLVRLEYRHHVFAHRLLWKAYKNHNDYCAWIMMRGFESDAVVAHRKVLGKANVESGHLDRIRQLIDWDKVRERTVAMNKVSLEAGLLHKYIKIAQSVWTGSKHTEEWKRKRSAQATEMAKQDWWYERQLTFLDKAKEVRKETSCSNSKDLIQNAERNEEYLHKTSSLSKNKFISPEGLEFDSPIFAAKYYGNVKPHVIENWCKRNHHGWSRKPKQA